MLPLQALVCTPEAVKMLWEKFQEHRNWFSDELASDPIYFYAWIAAKDARGFLVGDPPVGLFLFTDITLGAGANAHIFLWDREQGTYEDRIKAAQIACSAMFKALELQRIGGLTPVTNVPAKAFAEKVGFKILGRAHRVLQQGGLWGDAWISELLPEHLEAPKDDTLKVEVP